MHYIKKNTASKFINDKKKWDAPRLKQLDFMMTQSGETVNVDTEGNNYEFSVLSP